MDVRQLIFASLALAAAGLAQADSVDLVTDFLTSGTSSVSSTVNYGYSASLGGTLTPYNNLAVARNGSGNIYTWTDTNLNTDAAPTVALNNSGSAYSSATDYIPSGWVYMHPGLASESSPLSEIQFTASAAGMYKIAASFASADVTGNRGVLAVIGSTGGVAGFTTLYSAAINTAEPPGGPTAADISSYSGDVSLAAGQSIVIGVQSTNSTGLYNGTLVQGSISPVPLPATFPLLLSGILGLGALGYRPRHLRGWRRADDKLKKEREVLF
jgi:hypothetical protein